MPGPLSGIKVVDASAVLSGPLAAMMLADQGAEVVKVEPLGIGEIMRAGAFQRGGLCAFFANANRGKRGIALDVAKPQGRDVLLRLAREADVFIQNFRPGAVERLGIADSDLRAENPDLIYCSISGYGDSGPYKDRRVYDPIIQGLSGNVAVQLNPDVPIPDLVRHVVCDKASAYTAAQAITAALFARERGAGGQHIRVPMLDASVAFFWPDGMMAHTMVGDGVERPGPTLYQIYRLTETNDGHLIYFAASDSEFHGLFRALERPDLAEDERFATLQARSVPENFEAVGAILFEEFRKWSTDDILPRLLAEQVPAGPVHSLEQVIDDPQIRHNGVILERDHPVAGTIRQAAPAARFDKTPQEAGRLPPLHGEHTEEVLAEIGFDEATREKLRADGVIA